MADDIGSFQIAMNNLVPMHLLFYDIFYIKSKHYLPHYRDRLFLWDSSSLLDLQLKAFSVAVLHEDYA
jgi:hypothetical protein